MRDVSSKMVANDVMCNPSNLYRLAGCRASRGSPLDEEDYSIYNVVKGNVVREVFLQVIIIL